jgi:hypothetical protein
VLPFTWFGCQTWSVTSRRKRRLKVSENRVLRGDEVTGDWRKLHNEDLRG